MANDKFVFLFSFSTNGQNFNDIPKQILMIHLRIFKYILTVFSEYNFFIYLYFLISAVQNERQPRNTATIRPETLRDMTVDQERALREAAVAVGVFG